MKTLSKEGVELISKFEGIRLKPYKCSAGVSTIGIGSTYYEDKTRVKMSDPEITRDRAIQLFSNTAKQYQSAVRAFIKIELTQNQFDALVSLCYNIGPGNFSTSSLVKAINNKADKTEIEARWKLWNKAKGNVIQGLVSRRNKEVEYYFK
jgi:lysozyme